ncbi:MAG: MFS transporter [Betaproteobacteria bacterium]
MRTRLPVIQDEPTGTRAIAILAVAGFFSSAAFRICDSLLPQLATTFGSSTGEAAHTITVFAVAYGSLQVLWGPIGDRFGKYRTAAFATLACAVGNVGAVFADSLTALTIWRAIAGATGGGIIPLSFAWIGDTIPYARRQAVLARFLTATILGVASGQFIGGLFADTLGWRWAFAVLASSYVVAGALLQFEVRRHRRLRASADAATQLASQVAAAPRLPFRSQVGAILSDRWARIVLATVGIEGAIIFGALAFVPADLHERLGISLTAAGGIVAAYGLGGVAYTLVARRLVARLGERGLAQYGGVVMLPAFAALWLGPGWQTALVGCFVAGFGFYMLHNTLQTNATQMAPETRGTAVAMFASSFFVGQSIGVAIASLMVDHAGIRWLFPIAMVLLPLLATAFARALRTRPSRHFV